VRIASDGVTAVSSRQRRRAGTGVRAMLVTAALVAAVVVFALMSRPPARLDLVAASPADNTIAGAFHIHTNRSDGRGTPDAVARAAARANLGFVVFTDHGDGTRTPDPPTYREGVLCLDGVEISTAGGHYIGIGMAAASYPLGGEARDVIEDVRRLGGFGIVAHPDSPKPELAWRDWTLPFDGVEVVNLDTGWRQRAGVAGWSGAFSLMRALAGYPLRPSETLADLLTATPADLSPYDAVSNRRSVVAVAGADAHAKLALFDSEPGDNRFSLPFPGYASVFRALTIRIRLDRPLNGDAAADGAAVLGAIREGRLYGVADGLASPPAFEFTAEHGEQVVREGGRIRADGPVLFRVRSNAPPPFTTLIKSGARALAAGNGPELTVRAGEPGAYRVEIRRADATGERTWLLSNPIYIGEEEPSHASETAHAPRGSRPLYSGGDGKDWNVEADPRSKAGLELTLQPNRQLKLAYQLADGPPAGQFAALAQGTPGGVAPFDRIAFTARADRPMRISVQLRVENSPGRGDRWQRSVFLDGTARTYVVPFPEMTPVGEVEAGLRASKVHSVMFVVELTNTKPGSAGAFWVSDVRLEH
jgi:hypothetical protein